jgi:hypothetical protein
MPKLAMYTTLDQHQAPLNTYNTPIEHTQIHSTSFQSLPY